MYRLCLDAGFTCPNRDGTLGTGGCAYCSEQGSWGAGEERKTLDIQVQREIERVRRRYNARKYIAYFQAYSNTYAPPQTLKEIYDSVILNNRDFVGLTIGTRPDCIDREKLALISSYRERGIDVWLEYGLQSAHDETLELIGRGHTVQDFRDAVLMTKEYDILVMAHVIIGLPREGKSHIVETARFLSELPVDGLKIHNLNIVKGTRMADWYQRGEVIPLSLGEYANYVVDFLEVIEPGIVIARLVADSHPACLIEPKWSLNKQNALKEIMNTFERRKTWQGKLCSKVKK